MPDFDMDAALEDTFSKALIGSRQHVGIHGLLEDGGSVLSESANPFGGDFHEAEHEIEYHGAGDGPFSWGYATKGCVQHELARIGFIVRSIVPSSRGGGFYICPASKLAAQLPVG